MFDVWIGDIELTTAVLIFSIVVILPSQLLLCFKVKSRVIRLFPVVALFMLTIILYCIAMESYELSGLGYLILAIFTGFMLLMCGISWGIWAITKLVKKKRSNH